MKTLFGFAALAVTALALQAQRVEAQTANAGSSSTSSSGSTSASGSSATSTSGTSGNAQSTQQRATNSNTTPITFNSNTPANTTGSLSTNSTGSGTYNNVQSGFTSSDVTVRTTPTVYAPPVSGGNPCTIGMSGGASFIGWGAALGGTWVDQDCADRQAIAMVHNAGYTAEAREMMCNNKAFYMAARSVAKPCAARPQFDGPSAPQPVQPMVRQQPVPIAPPQQVIVKDRTNLPRCSRTITDNCYAG